MFAQLLRTALRPFAGAPKSPSRAGVRLELELLESRETPAVQTWHVTSDSDSSTDTHSLRHLLTKANSWMWMNDSFVIKVDVAAINITQALPGLYRNIEIDGNSVTISRTGTDRYRIFEVGVERTCSIYAVTMLNGSADEGGAIKNWGKLTLGGDQINCNTAGTPDTAGYGGGIWNHGTMYVDDCYISGNTAKYGGGILNSSGTITIDEGTVITENRADADGGGIENGQGAELIFVSSTIEANTAGQFGGGLYNSGRLVMSSSTVSGNRTDTGAGAGQRGGSIFFDDSNDVTLTNVTISYNVAGTRGGGFYMENGHVNLYNCTIQHNECGTEANRVGTIGGGFYVANDSWLLIDGLSLTDNIAETAPGGAYEPSASVSGLNTVTGQPVVILV